MRYYPAERSEESPSFEEQRTRKNELVSMCVLILVITLAIYSIVFSGIDGTASAPVAPHRVIHVGRGSGGETAENTGTDDGVGLPDAGPGWPHTAGWK